jgi:hypothetical protein
LPSVRASVSMTTWSKLRLSLMACRSSTTLKGRFPRLAHPVALRFGAPSIRTWSLFPEGSLQGERRSWSFSRRPCRTLP